MTNKIIFIILGVVICVAILIIALKFNFVNFSNKQKTNNTTKNITNITTNQSTTKLTNNTTNKTENETRQKLLEEEMSAKLVQAKAICEGEFVDGHFIEDLSKIGTNGLPLTINGASVTIKCSKGKFSCSGSSCWGCIYRLGIEEDSPIAVAQWQENRFKLILSVDYNPSGVTIDICS